MHGSGGRPPASASAPPLAFTSGLPETVCDVLETERVLKPRHPGLSAGSARPCFPSPLFSLGFACVKSPEQGCSPRRPSLPARRSRGRFCVPCATRDLPGWQGRARQAVALRLSRPVALTPTAPQPRCTGWVSRRPTPPALRGQRCPRQAWQPPWPRWCQAGSLCWEPGPGTRPRCPRGHREHGAPLGARGSGGFPGERGWPGRYGSHSPGETRWCPWPAGSRGLIPAVLRGAQWRSPHPCGPLGSRHSPQDPGPALAVDAGIWPPAPRG